MGILGTPKYSCENCINLHFKEIVNEVVDWINLSEDTDQWKDLLNIIALEFLERWRNP
jgi:Zn-finger protein